MYCLLLFEDVDSICIFFFFDDFLLDFVFENVVKDFVCDIGCEFKEIDD